MLCLACIITLSFTFQDYLIHFVAQCFLLSRAGLLADNEEKFADFLLDKNRVEPARLLYKDLIGRVSRQEPGEKFASLSLDLAECCFKQGQLKEGFATVAGLLQNRQLRLEKDKFAQLFLRSSFLLDQYDKRATESKSELMARSELLNKLSQNRMPGHNAILKRTMRKLLSLTQTYLCGLSPVARTQWKYGPADSLKQMVAKAVSAVLADPHFAVDMDLLNLISSVHITERYPEILKSLIANLTIAKTSKDKLRLSLLFAAYHQQPALFRERLKQFYTESDDRGLRRDTLLNMAFADAQLGNFSGALENISQAKELEEHTHERTVRLTEVSEIELLSEMKQLRRARQLCKVLANRLSGLMKLAPPETVFDRMVYTSGGGNFRPEPERMQAGYKKAIESCLDAGELELAAELVTDLNSLEQKNNLPANQDWACASFLPLMDKIKSGEIKDPALVRAAKAMLAYGGIDRNELRAYTPGTYKQLDDLIKPLHVWE